ncbi:tonB-system energizer ExbB [Klebsiella michiganensis]|nr:tonB-system energizer ExbB [Klebsiella michiganensis]
MGNNLMQADLSVWGMYHHADIVVKVVMIGLILASVVTWAIFFGKGAEILVSKRRLKREQQLVAEARSLDQASDIANGFDAKSLTSQLINEAQNELELSAGSEDNEGIKERTGFRLERRVAAVGRYMGRGNGYLATIGAISPFVGLFGTVWGIMNSFIGIAQTQTTNLAVVAPGIAEALLYHGNWPVRCDSGGGHLQHFCPHDRQLQSVPWRCRRPGSAAAKPRPGPERQRR